MPAHTSKHLSISVRIKILDGELTMASKPLIALSFRQLIFPGSGKISSLIKIRAPFFRAGIAALSVSIAFSSYKL
jgi:hypothetical protein